MARFVAHGLVRMDAVVPDEMNAAGDRRLRGRHPGRARTAPRCRRRSRGLLRPVGSSSCPTIAGALHSLVGPDPTIDHHAVHIRQPHEGQAQHLHGDAIIDVRTDAFDVQLMYYPQDVTLEMGGTLSVPGQPPAADQRDRHRPLPEPARPDPARLPRRHRRDPAPRHLARRPAQRQRHQALHVQDPVQPDRPAGPAVEHRRPGRPGGRSTSCAPASRGTRTPPARLEFYNRIMMWRALTGDDTFDLDYWATRVTQPSAARRHAPQRRPQARAPRRSPDDQDDGHGSRTTAR